MEISTIKNGGYKLRGKKSFATISANVITINDSFTIDGPGEYEVGGVDVIGLKDNAFTIRIDDVRVGYLTRKLTGEEKERLGTINIAIVPSAQDYDTDLEPSYLIPMQSSQTTDVAQPKLVTSADKLPETTTVVVLE